MSILKVWQLTLIQQSKTLSGEVIQKKRLFYTLLIRKHDFWPFHWFSNGQKWGGLKSFSLCPLWRFDNWLLFWQSKTPWEEVIQKNGLFYTLLMRKHDFSPFHWFLNGQIWGFKKLLSMSILKVWQLTLILAKQDPVEGGHIEKGFLHSSDEKTWFLTFPLIFKWSPMGGFKKASLYVYFEGLTTDSYFGKARLPGERLYRKNGLYTLFWWENMISHLSIDFQMVTNGGV